MARARGAPLDALEGSGVVEWVCRIVGYDVVAVAALAQLVAVFHWAGFALLLLLPAMAAYYGWEMVSAILRMFGPQLAQAAQQQPKARGGKSAADGDDDDDEGAGGSDGRRKLTGAQRRAMNRQRVG
jgi:SRP-independent targeting protein 2/TMEM208